MVPLSARAAQLPKEHDMYNDYHPHQQSNHTISHSSLYPSSQHIGHQTWIASAAADDALLEDEQFAAEQWDEPCQGGTNANACKQQQLQEFHRHNGAYQQQQAVPGMDSDVGLDCSSYGDDLRAVRDLPICFHGLFPAFRYFNPVQSESFATAYTTDVNMVVAAPTGSGKTGVMEIAMLGLYKKQLDAQQQFQHQRGTSKVVYLAPMRALVQEKMRDWHKRFGGTLGLKCLEVTGDTDPEPSELEEADILCTTPEKFDSMTRRTQQQGGGKHFAEIALVLIDEVHLLAEQGRGCALEAGVISRIKMLSTFPELQGFPISRVRFVAVSATIPNVKDIAEWLQAPEAGLKVYGEEMRPCKLRTVVRSYAPSKNDFLFERRLNDYLPGVIAEFCKGKPCLVFCSSRKGTMESAAHLVKDCGRSARPGLGSCYIRDAGQAERLRQAAQGTRNKALQAAIAAGIGFHNAAMENEDRAVVEQLFLQQDLLVLCTTSTLALGVNLPAHLVVIKGTRRYCGEQDIASKDSPGYREYDRSVCLQMVGRAGRPQFDTEGVAVIMTQKQTTHRYLNLLNGAEEVESCMLESFTEYLNAEIVLQTVKDAQMAIDWLRTTFLYIRIRKNPQHYLAGKVVLQSEAHLEQFLRSELILKNVQKLTQHGLASADEATKQLLPLEPGKLMSHYYISFDTMIHITLTPPRCGMATLLGVITKAKELQNIRLRRGEKKLLNDMNNRKAEGGPKYRVMDPSRPDRPKERITSAEEKIFILLNEALCDNPADTADYSMRQEQATILRTGARMAECMSRYFGHLKALAATGNSVRLAKALRQRLWEDTARQCRQLPNIGKLLGDRLAGAGLGSFQALMEAEPRRIEAVAQRHYPFGNQVKQELRAKLPPKVSIQLQALPGEAGGRLQLELTADREDGQQFGLQNRTYGRVLVGCIDTDTLLLNQSFILEQFPSPAVVRCSLPIPYGHHTPIRLVACLLVERWAGLDVTTTLAHTPGQAAPRSHPAPPPQQPTYPPALQAQHAPQAPPVCSEGSSESEQLAADDASRQGGPAAQPLADESSAGCSAVGASPVQASPYTPISQITRSRQASRAPREPSIKIIHGVQPAASQRAAPPAAWAAGGWQDVKTCSTAAAKRKYPGSSTAAEEVVLGGGLPRWAVAYGGSSSMPATGAAPQERRTPPKQHIDWTQYLVAEDDAKPPPSHPQHPPTPLHTSSAAAGPAVRTSLLAPRQPRPPPQMLQPTDSRKRLRQAPDLQPGGGGLPHLPQQGALHRLNPQSAGPASTTPLSATRAASSSREGAAMAGAGLVPGPPRGGSNIFSAFQFATQLQQPGGASQQQLQQAGGASQQQGSHHSAASGGRPRGLKGLSVGYAASRPVAAGGGAAADDHLHSVVKLPPPSSQRPTPVGCTVAGDEQQPYVLQLLQQKLAKQPFIPDSYIQRQPRHLPSPSKPPPHTQHHLPPDNTPPPSPPPADDEVISWLASPPKAPPAASKQHPRADTCAPSLPAQQPAAHLSARKAAAVAGGPPPPSTSNHHPAAEAASPAPPAAREQLPWEYLLNRPYQQKHAVHTAKPPPSSHNSPPSPPPANASLPQAPTPTSYPPWHDPALPRTFHPAPAHTPPAHSPPPVVALPAATLQASILKGPRLPTSLHPQAPPAPQPTAHQPLVPSLLRRPTLHKMVEDQAGPQLRPADAANPLPSLRPQFRPRIVRTWALDGDATDTGPKAPSSHIATTQPSQMPAGDEADRKTAGKCSSGQRASGRQREGAQQPLLEGGPDGAAACGVSRKQPDTGTQAAQVVPALKQRTALSILFPYIPARPHK